MSIFSQTIAAATIALLSITQAFAIDKTAVGKKASALVQIAAETLEHSIKVSTNVRPMTTHDDIAAQLLGPRFMKPIAENLAR